MYMTARKKITGIMCAVIVTLVCVVYIYKPVVKNIVRECSRVNEDRYLSLPEYMAPTVSSYQPVNQSIEPYETVLTYASRIFSYPSPQTLEDEKFTIVMMTFKRLNVLRGLIKHYCKSPHLDLMLIVWNDIDSSIPGDLKNITCWVPIRYVLSTENKVTNRYKPRPEIKTDCVMLIDDDRQIEIEDLVLGFRTWQQFRHRIVGYEHRTHEIKDGEYYYIPQPAKIKELGYSMLISATFILHYGYLEMFNDSHVFPQEASQHMDESKNCEDIAMCLMVGKFLEDLKMPQCSVLAVKPTKKIKNLEDHTSGGFHGLSKRPDHYKQRSACLNNFTNFYENRRLPLHYTHIRIVAEL